MSGMGGGTGGGVTRISTRMAPAPARGPVGPSRTTFAVGKLSWRRSEIRVVEPRRLEARRNLRWAADAVETVH